MPASAQSQQPRLLDEVRQVLRLHHYSIHTERSYADWIVRFVRYHHMRCRADLLPPTQNLAMNALIFLYKRVLKLSMEGDINAVRADRKVHVPVVMTREEVAVGHLLDEWHATARCQVALR